MNLGNPIETIVYYLVIEMMTFLGMYGYILDKIYNES